MARWMVTVLVTKDKDQIGHEMYAVAINDAAQAIETVLKAAAGEAAVVNGLPVTSSCHRNPYKLN